MHRRELKERLVYLKFMNKELGKLTQERRQAEKAAGQADYEFRLRCAGVIPFYRRYGWTAPGVRRWF